MREEIDAFFAEPVSVILNGTSRRLQFADLQQLRDWARSEEKFWSDLDVPSHSNQTVRSLAGNQLGRTRQLREFCDQLLGWQATEDINPSLKQQVKDTLRAVRTNLSYLEQGELLSQDSPIVPRMREIARTDVEAAWIYRVLFGKNTEAVAHIPSAVLLRAVINATSAADVRGEIDSVQGRIAQFFGDAQQAVADTASTRAEEQEKLEQFWKACRGSAGARDKDWIEQKEGFDHQWSAMKKAYDEEIALAAPTTYWKAKARIHFWAAIGFAIAFVLLIVWALREFFASTVPGLSGIKEGQFPWSAIVPAVVCAFAAIWVLRIVGRQLSNHLQLLEDAGERQAMVKTFLALVHDETRGKALVTDNDRILILHALFRPSHLKAIDDAPPAHWFDLLTSKIGQKPQG